MKYRFGILGYLIHLFLMIMILLLRVSFFLLSLAFFVVMVASLSELFGGTGELKYFIAFVVLSPSILIIFTPLAILFGDTKIGGIIYFFVAYVIPIIGWVLAFYSFISIYGFLVFLLWLFSPLIFIAAYLALGLTDSFLETVNQPRKDQMTLSKTPPGTTNIHHESLQREPNIRLVACEMSLWSITELHKNEISLDNSMRLFILSAAWLIIYFYHTEHKITTERKQTNKDSMNDFHLFFRIPVIRQKLSLDFAGDEYLALKEFLMKADKYIHSKQGKEKEIFEHFVQSCRAIAHNGGGAEKYRILFLPIYNTENRNIVLRIINNNAKELVFL